MLTGDQMSKTNKRQYYNIKNNKLPKTRRIFKCENQKYAHRFFLSRIYIIHWHRKAIYVSIAQANKWLHGTCFNNNLFSSLFTYGRQ